MTCLTSLTFWGRAISVITITSSGWGLTPSSVTNCLNNSVWLLPEFTLGWGEFDTSGFQVLEYFLQESVMLFNWVSMNQNVVLNNHDALHVVKYLGHFSLKNFTRTGGPRTAVFWICNSPLVSEMLCIWSSRRLEDLPVSRSGIQPSEHSRLRQYIQDFINSWQCIFLTDNATIKASEILRTPQLNSL